MPRPNKRVVILLVAIATVGLWFGTTSRYPAINQKASVASVLQNSGALSFDPILEVQPDFPYWKKVAYSTVNWANTNKKGMTFGVAIAGLFMTLLTAMNPERLRGRIASTLFGAITGSPLGLCANCSAPIASAVYQASQRAETALALMISSPTLNVIIITMSFSLFPIEMALTKIGLSVLVIATIPFLVKPERLRAVEGAHEDIACAVPGATQISLDTEGWREALHGTARAVLKNWGFVIVRTVPLMFVAGFLGAVLVSSFDAGPALSAEPGLGLLVVASLIGTILPAPIAFDVITAQAFLSAGVAKGYVMTLLFTLGSYSIYSTFIVYKTISRSIAGMLFALVFTLGVVSGGAIEYLSRIDMQRSIAALESVFDSAPASAPAERVAAVHPASSQSDAAPHAAGASQPMRAELELVWSGEGVDVLARPHQPRVGGARGVFAKLEGPEVGLDRWDRLGIDRFVPPYITGRGIASGDFDGDGWVDLVLAVHDGIALYRNVPFGGFEEVPLALPTSVVDDAFYVAFADLDDDGWLDLYVSSYRKPAVFLLNQRGRFDAARAVFVEGGPESVAKSVSFSDIDRDRDLDFFVGNWYHPGPTHGTPWVENRNHLYENDLYQKGAPLLRARRLEDVAGVTQSVLFTDFDGDHIQDLIVANDFLTQDFYYRGDGKGGFTPLEGGSQGIPETPDLSMAIDSGDLDNDLVPDLYATNTGGSFNASPFVQLPTSQYCVDVIDAEAKAECERTVDASRLLVPRKISSATFAQCKALPDPVDGDRCAATAARITAIRAKRPDLCERIPDRMAHVRADCEGFFAGHREPRDYAHMPINQAKQRNILLHGKGGGRFESVSKAWNAHDTAWSWTGKFGDLDNDGWQDVYVVNGRWGWGNSLVPNVFLRNMAGERFELAQDEYGLSDYPVVSGYTYVDLDNDGDLDIVTNAVAAPHRVYVNGAGAAGRSLTVELRDHRGNRMGIGSKVVVRGADGSTRFREVKAGGGFMSFDAPVLHFGLGSLEEVASVEVIWSTGERTVIDAALATGQHLLIERRLEAAPELAAQGGR